MKEAELKVKNPTGIHARPASLLCNMASHYQSRVTLTNKRSAKTANAKSIMGVLALGMNQGTTIVLKADGEDEEEAIKALSELINGFTD